MAIYKPTKSFSQFTWPFFRSSVSETLPLGNCNSCQYKPMLFLCSTSPSTREGKGTLC